ncbi:hypothetical protein K504DRAFT_537913 [Pleomassaria siparia CBS 279.74]|uniref:Alcohol dehydrogenase-like C-terminal domain-containing protein n=1 Tax=Pleomassaria siparia CBS 279.74 TaxID=1314801 RepID=A0A6G1JUX6_9PLEO|nr:hypothetical protein K504DRAFT_537913 [Pleomassaria siparia CBS 279.74]
MFRVFLHSEEFLEKIAVVLDIYGEQTFQHSMECVAIEGTIVSCGLHSGGQFAQVDLTKLFTPGIDVHGTYAGNRGDFENLVQFVTENQIEPLTHYVLPLEKVEEGIKMILEGAKGKTVIKMLMDPER